MHRSFFMHTRNAARLFDRTTPPHIGTLIIMAGLSALSMNIFLPSLPGMAEFFGTEYWVVQLTIPVYLAVNAVLQIIVGPISDKIGRRPVILWGMVGFLLATLGCIYSENIAVFLMFRMAQAIIVITMVLSRAIVRDIVSQDEAASMLGYVTMGIAVVPMIGPLIGGMLDQAFGWQSNFWLLFVLGALVLALTWSDIGETKSKTGLTLGQQFRQYPELLASPRFWGYSLASALSSGAFFAYLGGAPFVAKELFHMEPAVLGFFFGAPAAGYFLGNFISGRYSARFGVNRMVNWGCIINAVGVVVSMIFFLAGIGSEYSFFGLMTLVGVGNGMSIPNATAGAISVRPQLAGTASGLSGAIMLAGGASLSALAGALLTPESGAYPLLWIMLATALLGVAAIRVVIFRERQLGL